MHIRIDTSTHTLLVLLEPYVTSAHDSLVQLILVFDDRLLGCVVQLSTQEIDTVFARRHYLLINQITGHERATLSLGHIAMSIVDVYCMYR